MQPLRFESLAASNLYSITQTLNSRVMGKIDSPEQYDKTHEHLINILRSIGAKQISMVCELTRNADVHYHGMFTMPCASLDQVRYKVNNRIRKCKYFGFRQIDLVTDEPGWIDYIRKDLIHTHQLLARMPIVCDDLNAFGVGEQLEFMIKV